MRVVLEKLIPQEEGHYQGNMGEHASLLSVNQPDLD